jgi:hypothetical protein
MYFQNIIFILLLVNIITANEFMECVKRSEGYEPLDAYDINKIKSAHNGSVLCIDIFDHYDEIKLIDLIRDETFEYMLHKNYMLILYVRMLNIIIIL